MFTSMVNAENLSLFCEYREGPSEGAEISIDDSLVNGNFENIVVTAQTNCPDGSYSEDNIIFHCYDDSTTILVDRLFIINRYTGTMKSSVYWDDERKITHNAVCVKKEQLF
jgi:hypothetical protein